VTIAAGAISGATGTASGSLEQLLEFIARGALEGIGSSAREREPVERRAQSNDPQAPCECVTVASNGSPNLAFQQGARHRAFRVAFRYDGTQPDGCRCHWTEVVHRRDTSKSRTC